MPDYNNRFSLQEITTPWTIPCVFVRGSYGVSKFKIDDANDPRNGQWLDRPWYNFTVVAGYPAPNNPYENWTLWLSVGMKWDDAQRMAERDLHEGDHITLRGYIKKGTWTSKDGVEHEKQEIICAEFVEEDAPVTRRPAAPAAPVARPATTTSARPAPSYRSPAPAVNRPASHAPSVVASIDDDDPFDL